MREHKCLSEKRIEFNQRFKRLEYVRFQIAMMNTNSHGISITGQGVSLGGRKRTPKGWHRAERNHYIEHVYCPFCGVKYEDLTE